MVSGVGCTDHKGHKGTFWGAEYILHLGLVVIPMVFVHVNISVSCTPKSHFILCKLYSEKKGRRKKMLIQSLA